MRLFGLEQCNHGHCYRWVFTEEELVKRGFEPNDGDFVDIGFPIGGSNSSATFFRLLHSDIDVYNFLTSEFSTDLEDPMLVDIAEGIVTIDSSNEYGSITTNYIDIFKIPAEELTKDNSLMSKVQNMIKVLRAAKIDNIDFDNPFYGSSRDMRLSELEELYSLALSEPTHQLRIRMDLYMDMIPGETVDDAIARFRDEFSTENVTTETFAEIHGYTKVENL